MPTDQLKAQPGCCVADLPPEIAKAWLQSWKWAAITVAVVTSPVIGKVAKVSFERFLGTIAGETAAFILQATFTALLVFACGICL